MDPRERLYLQVISYLVPKLDHNYYLFNPRVYQYSKSENSLNTISSILFNRTVCTTAYPVYKSLIFEDDYY